MFYIEIILINAFAGFLSMLPFFIILELLAWKQIPNISLKHMIGDGIFGFLLSVILAVTGVPGLFEMQFDAAVNLIPFADIATNGLQYAANILLFLPVGFLLPVLYRRCQTFVRSASMGFLFSLSIELMQLFCLRATDVDDLITNTLGCAIGYGIFALLKTLYPPLTTVFTTVNEAANEERVLRASRSKKKLPNLYDPEAVIFMLAAWAGALLFLPLFKSVIWNIFL